MSVSIRAAVKRFGDEPAVDGISVDIPEGAFFTVLGPSGCGKSTLLRMIAGLDPVDSGEISLSGLPVSAPGVHVPPEARDVAVVSQTYALWPHMDVTGNVSFPLECNGLSRAEARAAAAPHLDTVSLTPFATRKPAELSGGQRQRVALARCLASGARVVLMDEPLANLDPHLRVRMEEELAAFHAASGATIIYITHDQREAMALATQVAVMEKGRFAQVAPPAEIHDRPATDHVARFIGQSAVLPATFTQGTADLGPLCVPLVAQAANRQGPGHVVIRPSDLRATSPERDQGEAIRATVDRVIYRGGHWDALAQVPGLAAPLPFASDRPLARGDTVALTAGPVWALP